MKKSGDAKRPSRPRLLSGEEIALWRHATLDVKPRGGRAPIAFEAAAPERAPAGAPRRPAPPIAPSPPAAPRPPAEKPLAPLERRLKRRLSRGKADVDDVIDLHGMTQARAHEALNAFLWRASDQGARLVLVITGKGRGPQAGDSHAADAGILRRQAPHWLRAPNLRAIVMSIEEATRPHGGQGALYVRLRRRS